jgi:anti-anti-sigma factor
VAPLSSLVSLSADGATLSVALDGELDLAAEVMLRCLVSDAVASGATRVRLDLVGVTFCESRGLRLLSQAVAGITEAGLGVAVVRQSDAVTRMRQLAVAADGASRRCDRPVADAHRQREVAFAPGPVAQEVCA